MDKTNLLNAKSSTTNNTNAMAEILTETELVLDVSSYQHRLRPYPRGTTSLVARETVYSGLRYRSTRKTYRRILPHTNPFYLIRNRMNGDSGKRERGESGDEGNYYFNTRITFVTFFSSIYKLLFHHYPPNLPMFARKPTLNSHLTFCPLSGDGNGRERKRRDTENMEVGEEVVEEEEEERLLSKYTANSSFLSFISLTERADNRIIVMPLAQRTNYHATSLRAHKNARNDTWHKKSICYLSRLAQPNHYHFQTHHSVSDGEEEAGEEQRAEEERKAAEKAAKRKAAMAARRQRKREKLRVLKAEGRFQKKGGPRNGATPETGTEATPPVPQPAPAPTSDQNGVTEPPRGPGSRLMPTGGKAKGSKRGKATAGKQTSTPATATPPAPEEWPCSVLVERIEGVTTQGDVDVVQGLIIDAVFAIPSTSSGSGAAPPPQVRNIRFRAGLVEVQARDEQSREFVRASLEGSSYRAVDGDDRLTLVFHVASKLITKGPEELLRILGMFNPDLPTGSLKYMSHADVGKGRVVVFVGVSREGHEFLRKLGFKLMMPIGVITLCPVRRR